MEDLEFKKVLITPRLAKDLLEANVLNRRVNKPVEQRYLNDMISGKWIEGTGETIKISKTGRILDGQHRLRALIKSGLSFYFYVSSNIDDKVFSVLDTGKSRNATDCFKVACVKNENQIPSIIAMYNLLKDNRRAGTQIHKKATNADLLAAYFENEIFWQEVVRMAHSYYLSFAKILSPSFIGGFYAYFNDLDPEKSEPFISQLTTGIAISNPAINLLRNKLMQDKMSQRKMPINLKIALIIKTWNIYIKNSNIKVLKFDTKRDPFPVALSAIDNLKMIQIQ